MGALAAAAQHSVAVAACAPRSVRDRREVHLHVKRRQKRGQKKREGEGDGAAEPDAGLVASDELAPLHEVRTKGKVVAAAFAPEEGKAREGELGRVTVVYSNNSVECWAVAEDGAERGFGVQGPGHRSDVRALALSADDSLLLSTSNAGAKVWNPRTGERRGASLGWDGRLCWPAWTPPRGSPVRRGPCRQVSAFGG